MIQQNNAKPHGGLVTQMMEEEGKRDGWDISLTNQPPNSPDLNVLDQGFFIAIQSLQSKQNLQRVDELIASVTQAFQDLDSQTLDNSFLTLQKVMENCLQGGGGNHYTLPHMNKAKLLREGRLSQSYICNSDILANALAEP